MFGVRYELVLASSGLALILALPLTVMTQGVDKLAAAPVAEASGEQASTSDAAVTVGPTNALPSSGPTDPATATDQILPPDPLASLDPADRAVAEKIRDLLAAKSDRFFASKKEGEAAAAFYQNRNLAPLWVEHGVANARAASVIARMKAADADGLEPSDYRPPSFEALGPEALAEAELKLTGTLRTFSPASPMRQIPPRRSTPSALSKSRIASSRRCSRSCVPSRVRGKARFQGRSRPSLPIWSAGAGTRATSATPMCSSTNRTSR